MSIACPVPPTVPEDRAPLELVPVIHYDAQHKRTVASRLARTHVSCRGVLELRTMVNLTRIYTRTGDGGQTRLGDMSETSKTDLRLRAYADVDEANAHLGLVLAQGDLDDDVVAVLTHVQNDLFDVGADFCTPVVPDPEYPPLRIEQDYVDRLEGWCDHYNEDLPKLRSFILNGGTTGAAHLHVARTVVRRAERSAWAAWRSTRTR